MELWVAVVAGVFSLAALAIRQLLEVHSLNRAIMAEVHRLLNVLRSHRKWWSDCMRDKNTDLPLIAFTTPVFDAQVKNIGRLNDSIVVHVAQFYGYVKFINSLQAARPGYGAKLAAFDQQYLDVLDIALTAFAPKFEPLYGEYGLTK